MNIEQEPNQKPLPKIMWLVAALMPGVLITVGVANNFSDGVMQAIAFMLNPAVSIFSSFMLLSRSGGDKPMPVLGAIGLGVILTVLNFVVGGSVGCAISGK